MYFTIRPLSSRRDSTPNPTELAAPEARCKSLPWYQLAGGQTSPAFPIPTRCRLGATPRHPVPPRSPPPQRHTSPGVLHSAHKRVFPRRFPISSRPPPSLAKKHTTPTHLIFSPPSKRTLLVLNPENPANRPHPPLLRRHLARCSLGRCARSSTCTPTPDSLLSLLYCCQDREVQRVLFNKSGLSQKKRKEENVHRRCE